MAGTTQRTERWHLESGSPDFPTTEAEVTINVLGAGTRVLRAAIAVAGGLVVALLVIPIPLVHLVGIPLAILGGLGLAVRLAGTHETLRRVRGTCPRCAHEQAFFVGIGLFGFTLPKELSCEQCNRVSRLVR